MHSIGLVPPRSLGYQSESLSARSSLGIWVREPREPPDCDTLTAFKSCSDMGGTPELSPCFSINVG